MWKHLEASLEVGWVGSNYRKLVQILGKFSETDPNVVFSLSLSLRPLAAGLGTRRGCRIVIGRLCCYLPSVPSSVLHAFQDC